MKKATPIILLALLVISAYFSWNLYRQNTILKSDLAIKELEIKGTKRALARCQAALYKCQTQTDTPASIKTTDVSEKVVVSNPMYPELVTNTVGNNMIAAYRAKRDAGAYPVMPTSVLVNAASLAYFLNAYPDITHLHCYLACDIYNSMPGNRDNLTLVMVGVNVPAAGAKTHIYYKLDDLAASTPYYLEHCNPCPPGTDCNIVPDNVIIHPAKK
ncbi:MAG: hypothetical protein JWQ38_2555 [Flavipsychrobacter sp.]|nr:hypothetical protein [Flavipsychrobacter sp.]